MVPIRIVKALSALILAFCSPSALKAQVAPSQALARTAEGSDAGVFQGSFVANGTTFRDKCRWTDRWVLSGVIFDLSRQEATITGKLTQLGSGGVNCRGGIQSVHHVIPLSVAGAAVSGSLRKSDYVIAVQGAVHGAVLTGTFTATAQTPFGGRDAGDFTLNRQSIEIILDPAPSNQRYVINRVPAMPTIKAKARLVNVAPDPTPTTTFTWTVSLSTDDVDFSSGFVQGATTQGTRPYTVTPKDPASFGGGQLKIKVEAMVNGNLLKGETPDGLTLEGMNPRSYQLQNYVSQQSPGDLHNLRDVDVRDVLWRIACRESGQRQFKVPANRDAGPPLISSDDGVGLFQITNAPCKPFEDCPNVIFNWKANADAAALAFVRKIVPALKFPSRMRASQQYHDYIVGTINPQRRSAGQRLIQGAPAPEFLASGGLNSDLSQLLRDTVRGYNGYAGPRRFGLRLHEYIPNSTFLVQGHVDDMGSVFVWRRVLPSERPPKIGDPAYVDHVKNSICED